MQNWKRFQVSYTVHFEFTTKKTENKLMIRMVIVFRTNFGSFFLIFEKQPIVKMYLGEVN